MDRLAAEGEVGTARTVPVGFDPGSDVANLSILGYSPSKYYSGRAPIEAEYRGIKLGPEDIAFRCNLVTLKSGASGSMDGSVMQDYSAGHISTKEAKSLILDIQKKLGSKEITFYPGMSYRHLMVWKNGKGKMRCTPPHDISGKKVDGRLPEGSGAEVLMSLMTKSKEVLMSHPVNQKRVQQGMNPASSIWLWGQGKRLTVPSFEEKYNLRGSLISAVDLTKGLGMCAGFEVLNVRGATGYIDTNYIGKANAALRALKKCDIVYVHVEAPDEAGHNGDLKAKMQAIEDFDEKVVGTIMEGLKKFDDYRILLMPDHYTPISVKTHTEEPVPFVIYRSADNSQSKKTQAKGYSESISRMKNITVFEKGYKLMDYFVKGK
jgi:2,3-bisphosphoglycerate-independent phosphoglycerate mutase